MIIKATLRPLALAASQFACAWGLPTKAGRGAESVLTATGDLDATCDLWADLYHPVPGLDGQAS